MANDKKQETLQKNKLLYEIYKRRLRKERGIKQAIKRLKKSLREAYELFLQMLQTYSRTENIIEQNIREEVIGAELLNLLLTFVRDGTAFRNNQTGGGNPNKKCLP